MALFQKKGRRPKPNHPDRRHCAVERICMAGKHDTVSLFQAGAQRRACVAPTSFPLVIIRHFISTFSRNRILSRKSRPDMYLNGSLRRTLFKYGPYPGNVLLQRKDRPHKKCVNIRSPSDCSNARVAGYQKTKSCAFESRLMKLSRESG